MQAERTTGMSEIKEFPFSDEHTYMLTSNTGHKILFNFNSFDMQHIPGRTSLAEEVRTDLAQSGKSGVDVACFSYLVTNHYAGVSDFFYLRHSEAYQSEERIQMDDMWVPVAVILEERMGMPKDFQVVQEEARHRLREGSGIRIICPEGQGEIDKWLNREGIDPSDRIHLLIFPEEMMPGLTINSAGIEMSVHLPMISEGSPEYKYADLLVILQDTHPGTYLAIKTDEGVGTESVPTLSEEKPKKSGTLSMIVAGVGSALGIVAIITALIISNRAPDPAVVAEEYILGNIEILDDEISNFITEDNWIMEEIGKEAIEDKVQESLQWSYSDPEELQGGYMVIALASATFEIQYNVLNSIYTVEVSLPFELVIQDDDVAAKPLFDNGQVSHNISDDIQAPNRGT